MVFTQWKVSNTLNYIKIENSHKSKTKYLLKKSSILDRSRSQPKKFNTNYSKFSNYKEDEEQDGGDDPHKENKEEEDID